MRTLEHLGLALAMVMSAAHLPHAATDGAASVTVSDLRCEYRRDPMAIDTPAPRLSWRLAAVDPAARGQRQTAYHLQVAASPTALDRGTADRWDSGPVTSANSHLVAYAGKALRAGDACFWRVRVADERGQWSAWSPAATWSMGPMSDADWTAGWIGTGQNFERGKGSPPPDNTLPDPWLCKRFELSAAPRRALMHVASIGYHELHVNGQKAGDAVLAPSATDHTRRARYVTYDITGLLRPGPNRLGLWLGTAWSIFPPYRTPDKPAAPIVLAQVDVELPDGTTRRIATDATWSWHPSPNTLLGVWDFMHFGGELYDANRERPDWCDPMRDDSGWKPVTTYSPRLTVSADTVEPNRLVHELKPVEIVESRPGVWRIDMGRVFAGWIEVPVEGQPGDRIEFQWSERREEPMTHRLRSVLILGPGGRATFRNRFNYGVGRWIQVQGLRKAPRPDTLRGWLIRSDYAPATAFECSDPLFNRIHAAILWTFENLSLGGYVVDCPQRERMGYGGDAHATTATGLDHFSLGAFYTKWSQDWRDVQGKAAAWGIDRKEGQAGSGTGIEPGNLPYTAPTYWGGGGPGWSGFCVTLPWELHRRYGDRRILETNFDTIARWLAFLETKSANDLLRRWGGEWDFLGDWLWPGAEGVNGDTRETLFFNNCYWIYNLDTAARIARALGRTPEAESWTDRARRVRAAVHREFYDPATANYVNGFQAYLAIALLTGLPPQPLEAGVWKRFEDEILTTRRGHFWGGITGGSFIVRALIDHDRPDLMYTMAHQQDYPGWGHMLAKGATTLWEDWEGKLSQCHSSYLHLGAWFIEGLAGIQPGPDGLGYQDFVLRPGVWTDSPIEWVTARFQSPYGTIESRWKREPQGCRYEFQVPPNTAATAVVPLQPSATLQLDGQPLKVTRPDPDRSPTRIPVRLEPGRHLIEVR
ncbi:MAG TPA: family 78 glycoside hydrolase catalytic domain [Verrucomicrobiota bacterium]|nr:family 78 glycoside hydrolase catalytic domain [Verrucomicrobiota bacterium]HNU51178.1 family 78 glycoside hydrolase catalytic domain [Verrucomicrobiota bacterium]